MPFSDKGFLIWYFLDAIEGSHPLNKNVWGDLCLQAQSDQKLFLYKVGFKKIKTGFKHKQKALENN